jgi:phage tail-like protein
MKYHPPVGYSFSVSFLLEGKFNPVDFVKANSPFDMNFKEVSGLTAEVQMDTVSEGGVLDYQHSLPKTAKFGNITLKRGLMLKSEIAHWVYDAIENFQFRPRNLLIILHGPLGLPIAAWVIEHALPFKWDISGFNAMDNAIVMETIEMTCRKHRRIMLKNNEGLISELRP